jgi:hypothetical protein
MLFLPFSVGFGRLINGHGVHQAGWVLVGVVGVLVLLVAASTRRAGTAEPTDAGRDLDDPVAGTTGQPGPIDVACRDLVALVTDYVDGVLPTDWRARLDQHLGECDGCTTYLQQIRTTVDLLAYLNTGRPHPAAPTDLDA